MSFLGILDKSRFAIFFFLIFLPAPFIGGVDPTALFVIRSLILFGFLIYLVRFFLLRQYALLNDVKALKIPLALFFLFLVLVFLQWQGGKNVFLKILPGTVQSFETRENFLQLVFYFVFFVLCLDFFRRKERVYFVVLVLAIQTVFLVALGYYQELSGLERFTKIYGFYLVEHASSFFSSFISANHYGGYLAAVSPLFLGSLIYYFEKSRLNFKPDVFFVLSVFLSALLGAILVSVFHAGARAAWVALLAVFAGALWAGPFRKKISFFVFSFSVFGFSAFFLARAAILPHIQPLSELPKNLESRLLFSRESLGLVKDFPLFGTGLGTYRWLSKAYQISEAANYFRPHVLNDYLELLADTGVAGFALWLTAFVFLAAAGVMKCLKSPSLWSRIMGLSSFVGIGLLAALSAVDYYLKTPAIALLFVFYLALLVRCGTMYVAVPEIRFEDLPDKSSFRKTAHFILFAMLLQGIAGLAFHAYREWRSEILLRRAANYFFDYKTMRRKKAPGGPYAMEALEEAVSLSPGNPALWFALGDEYRDEALGENASRAYRRAVEEAPTYPDYLMALGREEIRLGRISKGFDELSRAIRWAPHNRDYYLYLICAYLKASERAAQNETKTRWRLEALEWLKKAQDLPIPLTRADHRYLNQGVYALPKTDERLLLSLFNDLNE